MKFSEYIIESQYPIKEIQRLALNAWQELINLSKPTIDRNFNFQNFLSKWWENLPQDDGIMTAIRIIKNQNDFRSVVGRIKLKYGFDLNKEFDELVSNFENDEIHSLSMESKNIIESSYPDFRNSIDRIFQSIGHDIMPVAQDAEDAAEILAPTMYMHMPKNEYIEYQKLPLDEKYKQLLDVTKRYF